MEITINDQRKIFAVQKEFNDMFPFLKLEFYSKSNKKGGAPSAKIMKHISRTIADCRTIHSSGHITIKPQMTINELEEAFRDIYGLSILVFFKSADNWVQVSESKKRTLERQNDEGRKSTSKFVLV